MKTFISTHAKKWGLITFIIIMLGLLIYVALRAGPMAPITVTVTTVKIEPISPA